MTLDVYAEDSKMRMTLLITTSDLQTNSALKGVPKEVLAQYKSSFQNILIALCKEAAKYQKP